MKTAKLSDLKVGTYFMHGPITNPEIFLKIAPVKVLEKDYSAHIEGKSLLDYPDKESERVIFNLTKGSFSQLTPSTEVVPIEGVITCGMPKAEWILDNY